EKTPSRIIHASSPTRIMNNPGYYSRPRGAGFFPATDRQCLRPCHTFANLPGDLPMRFASLVLVVVACAPMNSVTLAAADSPRGFTALAIGDAAPDFKLPGVDGKDYTLQTFAEARLLLVVFTCNHCPTAQAYETRIAQLHAD